MRGVVGVEVEDVLVRGGEDDFFERDALGGFGEFGESGGGGRVGGGQACER